MEMRRDRNAEFRFYKLELKARRKRPVSEVSSAERVTSWIYEQLSDFGHSIFRPLIFSVLAFLGFAWIYANAAYVDHEAIIELRFSDIRKGIPTSIDRNDALLYSAERMLPVGSFGELSNCSAISQMVPKKNANSISCPDPVPLVGNTALGMGFLGAIQSLFSVISFFLISLAVRRKFQIS